MPGRPSFRAQLPHNLALVEMLLLGADDLIRLVPFAGEEDRVLGAGEPQRHRDGATPIWLAVVRLGAHPRFDLVENALGILRPRIVGGDNGDVGQVHGYLSHGGALAAITVTAGAEHHDDAS